MPAPAKPRLRRGRVYRTKDLARWGANASRLAARLTRDGYLVELRNGLFYRPHGKEPPDGHELMRAFLESAFLFTGPERWNELGLGTAAAREDQLVYNTKRSGEFRFGQLTFQLRRVGFPRRPAPEWFAIDLIQNHEVAGLGLDDLQRSLARAVTKGRLRAGELRKNAERYGTQRTQSVVNRALGQR